MNQYQGIYTELPKTKSMNTEITDDQLDLLKNAVCSLSTTIKNILEAKKRRVMNTQDNKPFQWTNFRVAEFAGYVKSRNKEGEYDIQVIMDEYIRDHSISEGGESKRGWEILQFQRIGGDECIWELQEGGKYKNLFSKGVGWNVDELLGNTTTALTYSVKSGGSLIKKVRRLSDGEVFTVGDLVESGGKNKKIIGLEVNDSWVSGLFATIEFGGQTDLFLLAKAPEVKEPLFVTTDGKDAFENDTVYHLCTLKDGAWKVSESRARKEILPIPFWFKYFSTYEAANSYVKWNKPMYSRQEMKDSYAAGNQEIFGKTFEVYMHEKELAQSKIKGDTDK